MKAIKRICGSNLKNILVIISVLFFSVGFNQHSYSQTLDDWKNCLKVANENRRSSSKKGYAGIVSIPYDDIRRQANVEYSTQKNLEIVIRSCNPNELGTKNLRNEIERLESNISNESDESKKNNLKKSLEEKEELLEDRIDKCEAKIDYCTRVYKARGYVKTQFEKAIYKAKYEKDPEIKAIADQLIDYWEDDIEGHEKAIVQARATIEKCKDCKNGYK